MQRPSQIWSVFIACLAIVAMALGWLTYRATKLDRAEAIGRRMMAVEENARLTLWRMDSAMATLVAQESARPFYAYQPFVGEKLPAKSKGEFRGAITPSPLMVEATPLIRLHFQLDEAGNISSPRLPLGRDKDRAVPKLLSEAAWNAANLRCAEIRERLNRRDILARLPDTERETALQMSAAEAGEQIGLDNRSQQGQQAQQADNLQQAATNAPAQGRAALQQKLSSDEYWARSQVFSQNSGNVSYFNRPMALSSLEGSNAAVMTPIWADGELLLARKITLDGAPMLQACWLDLPAIRKELLGSVAELLPNAELKPASSPAVEQTHLLASLPLELIPGELPAAWEASPSPMQLALIAGWTAFALAAAAVGILLWGVVSLSERRASFVSAVTHELRTPLTTFRLYSEMLSEGMVPDEPSRHRYLQTLRTEADRLMHLVENVLAYARLERGRIDKRIVPVAVQSLLERCQPRLAARAEQAGLSLAVDCDPHTMRSVVMADASAVEQILFNLVDNACKYAVSAPDRTLKLSASDEPGHVTICLQDGGPGIRAEEQGKLFSPFHKTAHEAAETAPGVGLGLALSRRLARAMGGDLLLKNSATGARFAIKLKTANGRPEGESGLA